MCVMEARAGEREQLRVAASALASAEEIFGGAVSDHLPLEFLIARPSPRLEVRVLSWNVMARGMCRRPTGARPSKRACQDSASELLTNNGLDADETIAQYERRLMEDVAPLVARWAAGATRTGAGGAPMPWVACLQEAPAHPGIFASFLQALSSSGGPSADRLGHASLCVSAAARVVSLWDRDQWDLRLQAHGAEGRALCTVLSALGLAGGGALLRVTSCHLPLDLGDPSGDEAVAGAPGAGPRAPAAAAACGAPAEPAGARPAQALLQAAPAGQLALVVGDLNFDVREARPLGGVAVACVPGSALYRGRRTTSDGALLAEGRAVRETLAALEEVPDAASELPLGRCSREEFVRQNVHFNLQARVLQMPQLADSDLADLGAHHFSDQPERLAQLASRRRAPGDPGGPRSPRPSMPPAGRLPSGGGGELARERVRTRPQGRARALPDEELRLPGQPPFGSPAAELHRLGGGPAPAAEGNEAAARRLMGLAPPPGAEPPGAGAASGGQCLFREAGGLLPRGVREEARRLQAARAGGRAGRRRPLRARPGAVLGAGGPHALAAGAPPAAPLRGWRAGASGGHGRPRRRYARGLGGRRPSRGRGGLVCRGCGRRRRRGRAGGGGGRTAAWQGCPACWRPWRWGSAWARRRIGWG
ncbi:unnamed protein product [Prorocentrum cordatum]|uniref:Endonuclease/exonuclease/phosphatase domain-containing protein n=1 Tax=Prorocentrum cordatum TaxID=2364126 RepID=A0ABN9W8N4_9DINO|nr:unnamed protein product [Polarella glacialis]